MAPDTQEGGQVSSTPAAMRKECTDWGAAEGRLVRNEQACWCPEGNREC